MAIDIYNPTGGTSMIPYNTTTPPSSTPGQPFDYSAAYGGIPNLPAYLTDTTSTTGTDVNAQMNQNLPGYQSMLSGDTANIQSNIAGQVSPDVINQLQQSAAERGIGIGSPGSTNSSAAYLKALGLNSMQLQTLGNTQLTSAMQRTPIQQQQTTTQNTDLGALRAMYAAAPVPASAAAANMNATRQGMNAGQGAGQIPAWQQAMNQLEQESQHVNDWFYQPVAGAGKAWSGVGVAPGAAGSPLPLSAGDAGSGDIGSGWADTVDPFGFGDLSGGYDYLGDYE